MIRFLIWFLFWMLLLFAPDVNVGYSDGMTIRFRGWYNRLFG